jgi:hypothetical protein
MLSYQDAYRALSIPKLARDVLSGSLDGGTNAAIECCDRWADDGRVAINWISRNFAKEEITFTKLRERSSRFANLLRARGIGQGDVVGGLLPRIPDFFVAALGAWRIGAIYQPLFTAFGPAAIESRVTATGGSQAKLIVTDESNLPKLSEVRNCPPVLVVDHGRTNVGGLAAELENYPVYCPPVLLQGSDPFVILVVSTRTETETGDALIKEIQRRSKKAHEVSRQVAQLYSDLRETTEIERWQKLRDLVAEGRKHTEAALKARTKLVIAVGDRMFEMGAPIWVLGDDPDRDVFGLSEMPDEEVFRGLLGLDD